MRVSEKRNPPSNIPPANEYESHAKELQICKTESYALIFSCMGALNSYLEYKGHAVNDFHHEALTKHAQDLQRCHTLLDQKQLKLEGLYEKLGAVDAKLVTPQQQETNSRSFDLDINLNVVKLGVYKSADEIAGVVQDKHDILWSPEFVSQIWEHRDQVTVRGLHARDRSSTIAQYAV